MKCLCGEEVSDNTGICNYCYADALEAIWNRPFTVDEAKEKKEIYLKDFKKSP